MKWRRAVIAVGISIPPIGLLGFGLTRDPGAIPSPLPGRAAPTFTLASFPSGGAAPAETAVTDSVSLAALRGDVVVLNFFASWCLACRDEHQALQTIATKYSGTDVHFFGVLYNDKRGNAVRWFAEMGSLPYPSLLDPHARTAIDYGLYGVPETFFIDRSGQVAYKHTGPVTEELLVKKIEELRAGPRAGSGGAP
jgi:cytochrome c biogenesis protein CcmG/thiol:disulfide interchange protein DsbE